MKKGDFDYAKYKKNNHKTPTLVSIIDDLEMIE